MSSTNETVITAILAVLGVGALGYIGYSSYSNAKEVAYGPSDAAAASTPTGGRKHRTKKSKHGKNKRTHKK